MSRVRRTSAPDLRLTARGLHPALLPGVPKGKRERGPTRTKYNERNQTRKRAGFMFLQSRADLSSKFMTAKVVGTFWTLLPKGSQAFHLLLDPPKSSKHCLKSQGRRIPFLLGTRLFCQPRSMFLQRASCTENSGRFTPDSWPVGVPRPRPITRTGI